MKKLKKILLKGSCHCRLVSFRVESSYVYPYQRCYCSICRKTQGGGGYSINLSADARTIKVTGQSQIKIYHARIKNSEDSRAHTSTAERAFCKTCGSALWLFSPGWPDLIHPFASAIDSPLPKTPVNTHLMLDFKASWVDPQLKPGDKKFKRYPKQSIAEWHDHHKLTGKGAKK